MKRHISLLLATVMILSVLFSLSSCDLINKLLNGDDPKPETYDEQPTINGVLLSDFTIVYDEDGLDYNKRAAEYIKERSAARFGVELSIVDDDSAEAENEIVVGETSRQISEKLNAECEGLEFAIMAEGGDIALEGDYFIIAAAAFYFMETYTSGSAYQATVPEEISVHTPIVREAKNFIMLIGDGMGTYQTKIFDYMQRDVEYSDGEDFFYGDLLPYQGYSRTRSLSGITDSAAGGTALSCGYKTYNEYVGLDKDGNAIKSLTELAYELGKSGAVMSTENQKGATPATFSAHVDSRDNSSDIYNSQLDAMQKYGTVIDCGFDYYTARYMNNLIEPHITETLEEISANENGFFLMYEEAHIDKHCHKNDLDKTYDAVVRFNQAIGRFMEFAFYHPDTFVLITADHETGGLAPNDEGKLTYSTEEHSAEDVPVFAWGYGADAIHGKTLENIEIAKLFASLMGVEGFGDQGEEWKNIIYGTEE